MRKFPALKSSSESIEKRKIEMGMSFVRKNQFSEALDRFKRTLQENQNLYPDILIPLYKRLIRNPHQPQLHLLVAELHIVLGQYRDAIYELEEVIELAPTNSHTYFLLCKIHSKTGFSSDLRDILEQAFEKDILDPYVLDILPRLYFEEKKIEKNISFYEKMIRLYPNTLHYYKILGECYIQAQRYEDAAATYNQTLSVFPDFKNEAAKFCESLLHPDTNHVGIRKILVSIYFKSCRPLQAIPHIRHLLESDTAFLDQSIQLYKEALHAYPETLEIQLELAKSLLKAAQYSEAVVHLKSIFETTPEYHDVVLELVNEILAAFPDQLMALLLISDYYFYKSAYSECLAYLARAINIDQEDYDPISDMLKNIREIAPLYQQQIIFLQAKIAFKKQEETVCRHLCHQLCLSEYKLDSILLLAQLDAQKGRYPDSFKRLFQALSHDPYEWQIHQTIKDLQAKLAASHANKKETELPKKPAHQDSHAFKLGLLMLRMGHLYRAIEQFQKLSSGSELKTKAQILIGYCFFELGRYDLSNNQFIRVLEQLPAESYLANTLRYLISMNHVKSGRYIQALEYLDRILEVDIHFPHIQELSAHYKKQRILDTQGKAITGIFSFIEDKPLNLVYVQLPEDLSKMAPEWVVMGFSHTHNSHGIDHMLQDNITAAQEAFRLSIGMDTNSPIASCNLALTYLLEGHYQAAIDYLTPLQEHHPKLELIHLNLGMAYGLTKAYTESEACLRNVIDLNPSHDVAHLMLGDICFKQKKIEHAFEHWKIAAQALHLLPLVQRRVHYLQRDSFGFSHWIYHFKPEFIPELTW